MSHASLRMIVHVANGVWRSVDQFATEEQRRDYVMPAVTGELTVAFTLTEPTAGTGADLRCEVEREGDTYYLSGEKHLITFGVSCDRWLLFARLAGTKGAEGTVALLVDRDTPNVAGRGHGRVARRARDRPRAPRLRPRPGAGHRHARRGGRGPAGRLRRLPHPEPDRGRDDLRRAGAAGAGAGRRARGASASPSASRSPQRQAISFALAENAADIEASRQLVLHAARRWEAGGAGRGGALLDGEADRGRHARPGHRQGAAGARRDRLLGLARRSSGSTATRARSASRRGRTRSRRRSSPARSSPPSTRRSPSGRSVARDGRRARRE